MWLLCTNRIVSLVALQLGLQRALQGITLDKGLPSNHILRRIKPILARLLHHVL